MLIFNDQSASAILHFISQIGLVEKVFMIYGNQLMHLSPTKYFAPNAEDTTIHVCGGALWCVGERQGTDHVHWKCLVNGIDSLIANLVPAVEEILA